MSSRRFTKAALATSIGLAALVNSALPAASAQAAGEQTCTTVSMDNTRLLHTVQGVERTKTVAVNVPAGEVTIPSARGWDAYANRANTPPQPSERYEVEFIGADGSIVGVSAPTGDVPDGVESAEWVGPLGSVVLSADAVGIRAHHRNDLPADGSPDSLNAGDITVCFAEAPPVIETTVPETTTPETVAPETTAPSTTAPETTEPQTTIPATTESVTSTTADSAISEVDAPLPPAAPAQVPTTVAAQAPTTAASPTATLPVTGSNTAWFVLGSTMLLAGGAFLLSVSRKARAAI